MIDFEKEDPLHWRDALQQPELRTKANKPTASRWHLFTKYGVKATTGDRVKLEWVKLPHGPHTSRSAILRFVRQLNGMESGGHSIVVENSTDAAMAELAAANLM